VESAPAPFLVSWLRLMHKPNARVRFGDMWREDLARYDVIYAFLSPSPMPDLWRKAQAEMRPGSLLISNSFEIPDITPARTLMLDDSRNTRLLIWRMEDVGQASTLYTNKRDTSQRPNSLATQRAVHGKCRWFQPAVDHRSWWLATRPASPKHQKR